MNFSIFNSKTIRVIGCVVLGFIVPFIAVNAVLKSYVLMTTTKMHFIQEIDSKTKHMHLNMADSDPHIIFVGSSHVEYHVSSAVFQKRGKLIYNYGVAGALFSNYPYMTQQAAKARPKYVALNIPITSLYEEDLQFKTMLHGTDVLAIWRSSLDAETKIRALQTYAASMNIIRIYADPIYDRLQALYRNLEPTPGSSQNGSAPKKEKLISADCDVIEQDQIAENRISCKCSNGDFLMIGKAALPKDKENVTLSSPHSAKIEFLQGIFEALREGGVEPVLVLEPNATKSYIYDSKELRQLLDVTVIDFSNFAIRADMWGDPGHLNAQGRQFYSRALAKKIRQCCP